MPRTADAEEFPVRAVLGQQVSTAAARSLAGRLVQAHGVPVNDSAGALTHLFPDPAALAGLDREQRAMPRARRTTVITLVNALATGEVDLGTGSDWHAARAQLSAVPGIGPWTVETIAMRALGDPDAFVPTDLGVKAAARALGLPSATAAPTAHSEAWQPWRSYAVQYL